MPRKVNLQNLAPDWSLCSKKAPWDFISTAELSQVLNLPLQTLHNFVGRGTLPRPEHHPEFEGLGNKRFFRLSTVRAAIESRTVEDIEWEWAKEHIAGVQNLAQARNTVALCYDLLGLEKPLI